MNGVGINMAHWENGESLQRILLLTDNEIWDVENALAKGKEQLVAPADGGELQWHFEYFGCLQLRTWLYSWGVLSHWVVMSILVPSLWSVWPGVLFSSIGALLDSFQQMNVAQSQAQARSRGKHFRNILAADVDGRLPLKVSDQVFLSIFYAQVSWFYMILL